MKSLPVFILLAIVTCTFVQFVNSFPTFDKSPLNTNSGGILLKRLPRATAVESDEYLWPNGEIPYKFNDTFLAEETCLIERAMYHIMWNSCIRFRIKSQNDTHWINFVNDTNRASTTGFPVFKEGIVRLAPCCFDMGTIIHEIMHSVGFLEEIKRNDRSEFVEIPDILPDFLETNEFERILTSYDFDSVMHYGSEVLSNQGNIDLKPKQPNITLKFPYEKEGLSKLDVEGINKLYKCANPLRLSYDFIRQFVEHYHGCVGKIYYDINRNNALNKVTLKSNKKRSISSNEINETTYDSTIIQGDILIRANKSPAFFEYNVQSSAINTATSVPFSNITTWTYGIIPYDLDTSLVTHKCLIENAMIQIMLNTCIRFRPRNDRDTFYVRIFQDYRYSFCYGSIGMDLEYRVSKVSLPNGCLDIGTVVHELLHVIGFYHHQNRQDRDQHLKIHDSNFFPNMSRNFDLNDPSWEQIFTPWDYDSVMLYGAKAFSKDNRSITMEPTVPGVVLKDVFDKPGLSKFDAIAINQLYKCPNVSNSNFYSDLSLMKPMLKLVKSCNSTSPENVESYQYIFR